MNTRLGKFFLVEAPHFLFGRLAWHIFLIFSVHLNPLHFLARENVSVSLGGKRAVHKVVEGRLVQVFSFEFEAFCRY